MKTYRVYGEYVQRVYVDVVAVDTEWACDKAADVKFNDWVRIEDDYTIDISEVDYV
jgi:hypothetical protein